MIRQLLRASFRQQTDELRNIDRLLAAWYPGIDLRNRKGVVAGCEDEWQTMSSKGVGHRIYRFVTKVDVEYSTVDVFSGLFHQLQCIFD